MANQFQANGLVAAGKATATTTEQVIDVDNSFGGFRKIMLDCSKCSSEVMFSIDVPITQSSKVIYLTEGTIFEEYLTGDKIYYKCASGTNTFNYVIL
ncbi:MAG: hypothetical protein ACXVA0_24075 [Mucilaginibacter sp.]